MRLVRLLRLVRLRMMKDRGAAAVNVCLPCQTGHFIVLARVAFVLGRANGRMDCIHIYIAANHGHGADPQSLDRKS